jgi:hypothetical protein
MVAPEGRHSRDHLLLEPLLPQQGCVAIWHRLNDGGHMRLIEGNLEEASNFDNIRGLARSPHRLFSVPLYAVGARSTGPHANDAPRGSTL